MNEPSEVRDGRDDMPVFIHSELDDYGLLSIEFRVYARLARRCYRGPGFESIPSMAKDFEVSDRTVRRAVRLLVECRLISETQRPGKTNLYTLTPRHYWQHKSLLKETRLRVQNRDSEARVTPDTTATPDTTDRGGVTPQTGVPLTPQTDEGNPLKVIPQGNPVNLSPARARDPVEVYEEVFREQLHIPGQTEIENEGIDDPELWREVCRDCYASRTPAKNVGTALRFYRERRRRKDADTKRAEARKTKARASPDDNWQPAPLTPEIIMASEGVNREEALVILSRI